MPLNRASWEFVVKHRLRTRSFSCLDHSAGRGTAQGAIQLALFSTAICMAVVPVSRIEAQGPPDNWSLIERHRIGDIDGDGLVLSRPTDLVVAANGNMFVLQSGSESVVVLSATGKVLRRIGRAGNGPGEMRLPIALGLLRDTLWVSDRTLRRVSLFSPAGKHVRDVPVGHVLSDAFVRPHAKALLWDKSTLISVIKANTTVGGRQELIVAVGEKGARGTLFTGRVPEVLRVPIRVNGEAGARTAPQPFSDHPLFAVSPDGKIIVQADRSLRSAIAAATFSVTWKNWEGLELASKRQSYQPVALTSALVERILPRLLEAPPGFPGKIETDEKALRKNLLRPRQVPPFSGLTVATDSSVWLRREDLANWRTRFMILAPAAGMGSTAELPFRVTAAFVRPPYIWAAVADEDDNYFIIKYEILKK